MGGWHSLINFKYLNLKKIFSSYYDAIKGKIKQNGLIYGIMLK